MGVLEVVVALEGIVVLVQDPHVYLLFVEEMEELINTLVPVLVLVHLFNVKDHVHAEAQVVLAVAQEALEVVQEAVEVVQEVVEVDQEAMEVVQEVVAHLVVDHQAAVVHLLKFSVHVVDLAAETQERAGEMAEEVQRKYMISSDNAFCNSNTVFHTKCLVLSLVFPIFNT